eukprot:1144061-Pelagomonas_calceolata.AAC.3
MSRHFPHCSQNIPRFKCLTNVFASLLTGLGVLGLGATAEPHHTTHSDKLHPFRIMGGFLAMVATLAVVSRSALLAGMNKCLLHLVLHYVHLC